MLIISQYSETIVNFDSVAICETDIEETTYNIDVYAFEVWRTIGKYKTEARAKEVLQEIIRAYNGKVECFSMPEK